MILGVLIEKEEGYWSSENKLENESNVESSSDREEEGKEIASANGSEAKDTHESDNDTENESQKQTILALKCPPPWTLKIPVNIVRTLMCTGHWSWHVLNALGTITTRFVLYVITRSPRREITSKRAFSGVTIVEQLHTKTRRSWKPIFVPLLKRKTKETTDFWSPSSVFYSFCNCCSKKFLKWYLVPGFIESIYYLSRVIKLIIS